MIPRIPFMRTFLANRCSEMKTKLQFLHQAIQHMSRGLLISTPFVHEPYQNEESSCSRPNKCASSFLVFLDPIFFLFFFLCTLIHLETICCTRRFLYAVMQWKYNGACAIIVIVFLMTIAWCPAGPAGVL